MGSAAHGDDEFAPEPWTGHRRGSRHYRRLLIALFFAGIATFAQLYSPQAVLPRIASEYLVDAASSALVISSATIGLAVGVIPWSLAADRLGRVRAMSIAVSAATVFGLLVPFAPNFALLLTGRALEGLMIGGVPAIAVAYLTEEIEPGNATRAAGSYVAGTTIGGLAGRLIAGPIADFASWRIGVLIVAIVCSAAAIAFIALAPASRGFEPNRGRLHPARNLRYRLVTNLRDIRLLAVYAQAFLLMGGFVALYNFLGFRLAASPFSIPESVVSLVFIAYLAGTWSSAQAGTLAARVGRWPVLIGATLIMIAGVLLTLAPTIALVLVGLVVATTGFFGAHAIASGWTGAISTIGRAQASSLYNLFYYAGSSLFGWLGGILFVRYGWAGTATMIASLAVVAVILSVTILNGSPAGRRPLQGNNSGPLEFDEGRTRP